MDVPNKKQKAIKVMVDSETWERVKNGPLKATNGRGAATWLRQLLIREIKVTDAVIR